MNTLKRMVSISPKMKEKGCINENPNKSRR